MSDFVYYQPNEKDPDEVYNDCVVRALTKVLGLSWLSVFDILASIARDKQCPLNCAPCFETLLYRRGFKYSDYKEAKTKPLTVKDFAKTHKRGKYFLKLNNHCVAVVNGKYFDVWDSGMKRVYGVWYKM